MLLACAQRSTSTRDLGGFGLFRFEGVDLFAEFVANFLNDYGFTVKEPPQHPPPPSPEGVDHHQTKTLEDFAPFVLEKLIS